MAGQAWCPFFPAPASPWPPHTTLLLASTSGFNYRTPGFLECIPRLPHCFMPHRVYPLHRGNEHRRERSERDKDRALLGGKLFSCPFLHSALGLFDTGSQMLHKYRNPIQTHCKCLLTLSHESCPAVITVAGGKPSCRFQDWEGCATLCTAVRVFPAWQVSHIAKPQVP